MLIEIEDTRNELAKYFKMSDTDSDLEQLIEKQGKKIADNLSRFIQLLPNSSLIEGWVLWNSDIEIKLGLNIQDIRFIVESLKIEKVNNRCKLIFLMDAQIGDYIELNRFNYELNFNDEQRNIVFEHASVNHGTGSNEILDPKETLLFVSFANLVVSLLTDYMHPRQIHGYLPLN